MFIKYYYKILLILYFLIVINIAIACDSTVLALIAGENLNANTVAKFLTISEQLEKEGEMLNAYDVASAKLTHKEIMKNWLKLVVDLGSAPMVPEEYKNEFSSYLPEIAKDLGRVRKKLENDNLENIHEIIEGCVTKISILGAQINNKKDIYKFLKLELLVYKPGMYLDDLDTFLTREEFINLENALNNHKNNFSIKANELANNLLMILKNHIKTVEEIKNKNINFEKIFVSYNDLKNSFVKMKQQLLDEGYFNNA